MESFNALRIIVSIAMLIAVPIYFSQVYARRKYVIYNLFKLKFNTTNISNYSECVEKIIIVKSNTTGKMISIIFLPRKFALENRIYTSNFQISTFDGINQLYIQYRQN